MGVSVVPPLTPRLGAGGWQEEWARSILKLLKKRARGEVLEPGKEEPGGVGGVEVVQEERWEEMRGTLWPGGDTFLKNNSRDIDC